jgi:hypothetical protein
VSNLLASISPRIAKKRLSPEQYDNWMDNQNSVESTAATITSSLNIITSSSDFSLDGAGAGSPVGTVSKMSSPKHATMRSESPSTALYCLHHIARTNKPSLAPSGRAGAEPMSPRSPHSPLFAAAMKHVSTAAVRERYVKTDTEPPTEHLVLAISQEQAESQLRRRAKDLSADGRSDGKSSDGKSSDDDDRMRAALEVKEREHKQVSASRMARASFV